jgi:GTP-binding protein
MFDDAKFVKGVATWDQLPRDGRPEVAFLGRSNVGKSSLINTLLQRKNLAYTSKTPGKTQEVNFFLIDGRFYLVDLPGFGYAKVPKKKREQWTRFVERYLREREPLAALVHLVDGRHPLTELDEDLIDYMRGEPVPYVIALTKADKLSGNERTNHVRRLRDRLDEVGLELPIILTSATSKRGRDELRQWIRQFVG